MANRSLERFVSTIVCILKYPRVPLSGRALPGVFKNCDFSEQTYSRSFATCNYSEQELKSKITNKGKNSNVTERILRFLKVNPETVIQQWKKELNTVPVALKTGTGLYGVYSYKLRKPSSLLRYANPVKDIKLSAKGIRHQFNFSEKIPHILKLIKQDLLTIKTSRKSN